MKIYYSLLVFVAILYTTIASAQSYYPMGEFKDIEMVNPYDGVAMALSADGNYLAMGAPWADITGNDQGQVMVYRWQGTAWEPMGNPLYGLEGGDEFGRSVALSGDGQRLAIGIPKDDGYANGTTMIGRVQVYQWTGTDWALMGNFLQGESPADYSGSSVALSEDGNRLAIGAPGNDLVATPSTGQVRVYEWTGTLWTQLGNDIDGDVAWGLLGHTVALSKTGEYLITGGPHNTSRSAGNGSVRVFKWDGRDWQQVGATINGENRGEYMGCAVAITNDGQRIAVGAMHHQPPNTTYFAAGSVTIYDWKNGQWQRLAEPIYGQEGGENAGRSIALDANGTHLAIGVPGYRNPRTELYALTDNGYTLQTTIVDTLAPENYENTRIALSKDGKRLAITYAQSFYTPTWQGIGRVRVYSECYSETFIQQTANTLYVSDLGARYQWLDANQENAPIAGATASYYSPQVNGRYALAITKDGCTGITKPYDFVFQSVVTDGNAIAVYPNPSKGPLVLDFGGLQATVELSLYAMDGRLVQATTLYEVQQTDWPLTAEAGVYVLKATINGQEQAPIRIVKR